MESIINTVNKLVKKYQTNDPFKIAAYLDIQVITENLGNTLGYYNKAFRIKSIHINENTTDGQKIFICGHELGHALLHPDSQTPFLKKNTFFSTEQIELEANYFAIQMIFSNEHFSDGLTIQEAVQHYGVPLKLLENNL